LKSRLSNLIANLKLRKPDNLKVIALSFGTAAIFWLFNALNKEYDTTVGYPITWQFDTEVYMVVDELPDRIQINVSGIGWNLLRASMGFKVKPISILLNNPATSKKVTGVSLTNRIDNELEDVQLNYILNDTLELNIDERGTRSFAIYVDSTNISLEENYRIVSPVLYDVDLLEIEGPLAMLNAIPSDSFLIYIKEQSINGNYSEEIDFEINRPELFLFRPRSSQVSFNVEEFVQAERQVTLEKIDFPEDSKITIIDSLCTVQFTVQKNLEQTVVADSFRIVANYSFTNSLDSTIMLDITGIPPEALDVRLVQPQVRLQYEQ
jgi:hypothetical protein